MKRQFLGWLKRQWLWIAFVVINLGLAAPLVAGWDNAICYDPEEEVLFPCCERCIFFCHCDVREGP